MSAQSLFTIAVVTILQLTALKATQHTGSRLYFTTSSLFDSRADVTVGAVLVRLAIPTTAGAATLFVHGGTGAAAIAAASGTAAWFLAVWPIVWNPRLLDQGWSWPLAAVVLGFQAAFSVLPVAGVAVAGWVSDSVGGDVPEFQSQYVWAVLTGIPISLVTTVLARVASRRVSFADDPFEPVFPVADYESFDEDWSPWRDWLKEAPLGTSPTRALLVAAATGAALSVCARKVLNRARR